MTDRPRADELLFLPLGGCGEIGMNLSLYGHAGKWLMVDLGITFGNESTPGIDVVLMYVMMPEMRLGLAGTASARAQVSILRKRFLKLGARVVTSVRRIVLHLPRSFPYLDNFHRLALHLGARSG